jgi:hypothetical protein
MLVCARPWLAAHHSVPADLAALRAKNTSTSGLGSKGRLLCPLLPEPLQLILASGG